MPPPVPPAVQLPADATPPQRIEAPPEIIPPELPPQPPPIEIPVAPPKTEPVQEEPEPDRPRRRATTPTPAQPTPAQPAPQQQPEQTPAAAPPKVPQLAPLISDEERRAFDSAIDSLISRTVQNIGRARSRTLTSEQKDNINRAEAFLAQAREIRKVDPMAAKSLAERAELLSRHASGQ